MEWTKLLNPERLGGAKVEDRGLDVRTEYERDADRIVFSGAFRRLSRKTQVHPLAANDHVHNRLTHSLETSHVGRALGKAVHAQIASDLPSHITASDMGAIIQAACLAHDIGNPPFGHAGEEAMKHWFSIHSHLFGALPDDERYDISQFDGNAQGFRILTQIENHIFKGGLRLTYATLATFLKYPLIPADGVDKFSVFLSEKTILDEVAAAVGMPKHGDKYLRHPLAYLVEAADDICYSVLDLEDAVELNILKFEEVVDLLLTPFGSSEYTRIEEQFGDAKMFRVNLSRMRGPVFQLLIDGAVEGFMNAYDDIMGDRPSTDVFKRLGEGDARAGIISRSKEVGKKLIYKDPKKVEVELGSYATLDALLTDLTDAARKQAQMLASGGEKIGWHSGLVLGLLGDHAPHKENAPTPSGWTEYLCYRRVIDFISGMTDNYATYLAKQMKGMGFTGLQRP